MAIPMDRERLHEKNRKLIYFIRKDHDVCGTLYLYLLAIGGFKGGARGLAPNNKFQEMLSGASIMQENFQQRGLRLIPRCGGLRPIPRCGSLQRSPGLPSWWEGGWLPLPKNPTSLSAFWASGFGPLGLGPDPK